jgi:hypothetical protein
MSPFNFQPVQLLELSEADTPSIDVQDGKMILTAQRGEERIRITAPLHQVMPQVKATEVKMPRTQRRGIPIGGGDKRVGELNGMAKLNEQHVREIRLMISDPKFMSSFRSKLALRIELAKAYNVHPATIKNVIENVSWKHVKI